MALDECGFPNEGKIEINWDLPKEENLSYITSLVRTCWRNVYNENRNYPENVTYECLKVDIILMCMNIPVLVNKDDNINLSSYDFVKEYLPSLIETIQRIAEERIATMIADHEMKERFSKREKIAKLEGKLEALDEISNCFHVDDFGEFNGEINYKDKPCQHNWVSEKIESYGILWWAKKKLVYRCSKCGATKEEWFGV